MRFHTEAWPSVASFAKRDSTNPHDGSAGIASDFNPHLCQPLVFASRDAAPRRCHSTLPGLCCDIRPVARFASDAHFYRIPASPRGRPHALWLDLCAPTFPPIPVSMVTTSRILLVGDDPAAHENLRQMFRPPEIRALDRTEPLGESLLFPTPQRESSVESVELIYAFHPADAIELVTEARAQDR